MKQAFILILCSLLIGFQSSFATSGDIDLSTMTPKEILDFYKKNPDAGKKRLDINYNEYIEGDYVVFRGEYKNIDGTAIENSNIKFNVSGEDYYYVTSEKGIFNLEMKKKEIEDSKKYNVSLEIEGYSIKTNINGSELKEKSIFHFEITKDSSLEKPLSLHNIHNNSFIEGSDKFKINAKIEEIPSKIGIQGIWLWLFIGLTVFGIGFFGYKQLVSKKKDEINIPSSLL